MLNSRKEVGTFQMEKKGNLRVHRAFTQTRAICPALACVLQNRSASGHSGETWQLDNVAAAVSWMAEQHALPLPPSMQLPREHKPSPVGNSELARLDLLTLCLKRCFSWVNLTSETVIKAASVQPLVWEGLPPPSFLPTFVNYELKTCVIRKDSAI